MFEAFDDSAIPQSASEDNSMDVKVLGTGCCASCHTTIALIEQVAKAKGMAIALAKVEDPKDIVTYGVMSTPAVVIDGKVVHAGGVPSRDKVAQWLSTVTTLVPTAAASDCCCAGR